MILISVLFIMASLKIDSKYSKSSNYMKYTYVEMWKSVYEIMLNESKKMTLVVLEFQKNVVQNK